VTVTFRPAKRENIPLLLGFAGGTGSGKTYTALLVSRGIAQGQPFVGIDTENGRMNHYADLFPELQVAQIDAPFRPTRYADAIDAADAFLAEQKVPLGQRVIVVDSASHEWYGDGGVLDWQEELMDGKESRRLMSWIEPKKAHKRMVTRLLRVKAHVILCFRAEPKVEMIDDPEKPGKKKFIEKRSLTGLNGWIPIAEKNLPYELTASFLLMADRPGVPLPIKLQEQHRALVPLDKPLSEETGKALAAWAAGSSAARAPGGTAPAAHAASADVEAISTDTLKERAAAAGIDLRAVGAKAKEVFGTDKVSTDLTDEQRGILWEALSAA
jgi:hypothetical protein